MLEQIKIIIQVEGKSLSAMLKHIHTDKPLKKSWVTRARKVLRWAITKRYYKCTARIHFPWINPNAKVNLCSFEVVSDQRERKGQRGRGGASGWPFPETREPIPNTEHNSGISKGEKWHQEQRGSWANVQTSESPSSAPAPQNEPQPVAHGSHRQGCLQILPNLKQNNPSQRFSSKDNTT